MVPVRPTTYAVFPISSSDVGRSSTSSSPGAIDDRHEAAAPVGPDQPTGVGRGGSPFGDLVPLTLGQRVDARVAAELDVDDQARPIGHVGDRRRRRPEGHHLAVLWDMRDRSSLTHHDDRADRVQTGGDDVFEGDQLLDAAVEPDVAAHGCGVRR